MAARREREMRFEQKMSDAEALMWNVEKDPWLNPSGALVTILDKPVDFDLFRGRIANAVAEIPRMRERVLPGLGRLSPPTWATDPEFDLDYHVRHLALPAPGTERQLYDLATRLYEDPFDRTRPLWTYVAISGLEGGRGALFSKMHHSISDGIGAVRLSEQYMDVEREVEPQEPVDLEAVIAAAIEAEHEEERGVQDQSPLGSIMKTAGHLVRRQGGIAQRALGEVATWTADPARVPEVAQEAVETLTGSVRQLNAEGDVPGGSPLWSNRSRHRHLESLTLPLDAVKSAGKALGGTVNDVFVVGAVNGSLRYHERRAEPVEALSISFVVSTRTDSSVGGNAFTPALLQVPGEPMDPETRFHTIRDLMHARREAVAHETGLSGLAGVANLLPTSVVTQVARAQASKLDFATSNLRGAPFPLYIAGSRVQRNVTMGPVAGTAMNITTLSYDGNMDIGLFMDPKAIAEPADLRDCMAEAYAELLEAGGVVLDD